MAIAGYAYFSRSEGYYEPVGPPPTWPVSARVYAVNDDGSLTFLGLGTYTAGAADYLGLRFGYFPPLAYMASVPELDLYYDITPHELKSYLPTNATPRPHIVRIDSGDSLLDPGSYELALIPPGSVVSGKTYVVTTEWVDTDANPFAVLVVLGVTEITNSLWDGFTITDDFHRNLAVVSALGDPSAPPAFWTDLIGTRETP